MYRTGAVRAARDPAPAGAGVRAAAVAGDVWCSVLELAAWRRRRQDPPLAGYQELCRELAASGPGTFGELDSTGARSVLRRYSDAWFATAKRRKKGPIPGIPGTRQLREGPGRPDTS